MSPEQARGDSLDYRSDIFSTGVVFYELLTCVRPFDGGSDLKSLDLVRECEFEPPSHLEGEVPPELDLVIDRALAEDPEERYDEINDMKVDLMEYLVSRGRAVTSEEIAEFLSDLFPEGLEREAFQEAREEADEPSGPMELDDALEYQLDQLDEDEEIDPLQETLPDEADKPAVEHMGRTETITPESGLEKGEDEGGEPPASQRSTAPDRPGAKRQDEETSDRSAESEEAETEQMSGDSRPWLPWFGAAAAVAVVAVIAGYAVVGGSGKGMLTVKTQPEGAVVHIDGSTVPGGTTPRDIRLESGTHSVQLNKEGHESETFRIVIEEDEHETLSTHLEPEKEVDARAKSREFVLRTEPPKAELWANQEKLGRSPQRIEVSQGQPKFVEAEKENCERAHVPVYHGRRDDVVRIELECSSAKADAESADSSESRTAKRNGRQKETRGAGSRRPSRVELAFRSTPEGASVTVGGEAVGTTPLREDFPRGKQLEVKFEKSGYKPAVEEVRVGRVEDGTVRVELEEREKGCLNFFAVHPQYNELAIDGEWLDGRRQKLRNYELAPGTHEIRVRNPDADRDETFTFEIEPGDECTSLTVWDPDEG